MTAYLFIACPSNFNAENFYVEIMADSYLEALIKARKQHPGNSFHEPSSEQEAEYYGKPVEWFIERDE